MPRGVERTLLALVVGLAVVGLASLGEFNMVPAHQILDVALYGAALTLLGWVDRRMLPLVVAVGALVAVRAAFALTSTDAGLGDVVQAHKWLLNIAVVLLCSGRVARIPDLAARMAWVLIPLALLKYVVEVVALGHDRPGLLYENNFEIALLCGLVVVALRDMAHYRLVLLGMLGVAVVLAGSRSGAIAFGITALFAVHTLIGAKAVRLYVAALTAAGAIVAAALLFAARYEAEGQVDRLNFAAIFGDETGERGLVGWLLGPPPMTALTTESCARLDFYAVLIADQSANECYSVVLHAFLLRVLFDFGLVGLVAAFAIPAYVMVRNHVPWPVVTALTLIAFSNSASVSGINNPFITLPIVLAILAGNARVADAPRPAVTGPDHSATPWRRHRPPEPTGARLPSTSRKDTP